jgi:hypothetical protein
MPLLKRSSTSNLETSLLSFLRRRMGGGVENCWTRRDDSLAGMYSPATSCAYSKIMHLRVFILSCSCHPSRFVFASFCTLFVHSSYSQDAVLICYALLVHFAVNSVSIYLLAYVTNTCSYGWGKIDGPSSEFRNLTDAVELKFARKNI